MSQEQNKKVDLEHFKTVITECDIMKHIETSSLKVSDQVIVWSIRAEYTNADRVLDSRSQIFARMWSKGLFHTLTVHVYVGIAILERERESWQWLIKLEKHVSPATLSFLGNFYLLHENSCTRIISQPCLKLKNWKDPKCPSTRDWLSKLSHGIQCNIIEL